ncbi:MAG TPA: acyltransferase [Tepidisphaeraceae bacterium]|jgi:acetyltransferase-like isoleucine patch superfamily enzyme|nr:acyltransferase [Tepidisphaeraceae bacterium]
MPRRIPNDWFNGFIPDNVLLEQGAHIETSQSFELFRSDQQPGLILGKSASIYPPTMFDIGPSGRVTIGQYSMLNGPRIICDAEIQIGDYCLIAWNVILMDNYRAPRDSDPRPIRIDNNVWIGFDTIILPRVTIGEGSIIGARSVVRENVSPYSIAAGNPARIIGRCD